MAIPEGYRLLQNSDVGKKFGIDLEQVIYFDTNADMSLLTIGDVTWIGGIIQSVKQHQLTMVFDSVLVWDKRNASVPSPYWIYDTYTIPSGTEITSYFTSGASWNNTFLYIKDIEEEEVEEEPTNPYLIKIKNKNGIILKTANKLCTENITLILDESLFEPTGPVLTLICDSSVLNSSNYIYSLDGGSTWNQFTSENMILENPTQIRFKGTGSAHIGHQLYVGASLGASDIARVSGTASNDFTITEDTTWYVRGYYSNGGND